MFLIKFNKSVPRRVFSTHASAPASNPVGKKGIGSCWVMIKILDLGTFCWRRRVTSNPLRPGMDMSSRIRSGGVLRPFELPPGHLWLGRELPNAAPTIKFPPASCGPFRYHQRSECARPVPRPCRGKSYPAELLLCERLPDSEVAAIATGNFTKIFAPLPFD